MPNDSHQRAAEFQQQAAHAHRAAAVHHGKEDHLTEHQLSQQAGVFYKSASNVSGVSGRAAEITKCSAKTRQVIEMSDA